MTAGTDLRAAVAAYADAGLCVLPAERVGDAKRPTVSWKAYQGRRPTEEEHTEWFGPASACCIVCGHVSGHVEMIDFDLEGEAFAPWVSIVEQDAPNLFARLVMESSPSGGKHVIYRCERPVGGNTKLASKVVHSDAPGPIRIGTKVYTTRRSDYGYEARAVLIETRGEGGLFLCAPSPGYVVEQGCLTRLPIITAEERDALLGAARRLDEVPVEVATARQGRPGDDWAARGDLRGLLERHGWRHVRTEGENEHWCRPGKAAGTSATLRNKLFYVFSSSAAPFEPGRAYGPFAVYGLLEAGGDWGLASRQLKDAGFGNDSGANAGPVVDLSRFMATPASDDEPETITLSEIEPTPIDWLWPHRIPAGMVTTIAGRQGSGKSTAVLSFAARITQGTDWPDGSPCVAGSVLLVASEDPYAQVVRPNFDYVGGDSARLHVLNERKAAFSLPKGIDRLRREIDRLGDVRMVVIDPIGSYLGGADSSQDSEVRDRLSPLARLAEDTGAAVVLLAHLRKMTSGPAMDRVMGSVAFTALSRVAYHVHTDPNDEQGRLFSCSKANITTTHWTMPFCIQNRQDGRMTYTRAMWDREPIRESADTMLERFEAEAAVSAQGGRQGRSETESWLRQAMASGERDAAEVFAEAAAEGHSKRQVEKASVAVGVTKKRNKDKWVWILPGAGLAGAFERKAP